MDKHIFRFNKAFSLLLLFVLAPLVSCSGEDEQQLMKKANDYVVERKISEAVITLKNALIVNPDNGEARFLLATIISQVGDTDSAEKEYSRAIQLGWRVEDAIIGKIQSMLDGKKFEKALDEIEIKDSYNVLTKASLLAQRAFAEAALGYKGLAQQSIALAKEANPEAYHVLKNVMQIEILAGDFDLAKQSLEAALKQFPDNSELLIFDALLKVQQDKDYTAAAGIFRKVIQMEPEKPVTVDSRKARLGLTKLEIQNNNLETADQILAPVLLQNEKDLEANYLGGLLAYKQSKFDLAEERLNVVVKVLPTHLQTQLLLGAVSYAQDKFEKAAYYLSKYVKSVPENVGARKLLGRTYMILGQHDEAKTSLLSGSSDGKDAELAALIGLTELQSGDFISGIGGLEEAVRLAPDSQVLRYELAKAYVATGDVEKAIQELERLLVEKGEKKQTELLLITAYLRSGDNQKAIQAAMQRLQQAPNDHVALTLVGNVYSVTGDKEEAKKYFLQAMQNKPEFVRAKMSLAEIFEGEGKYDEAIKLINQVSEDNPDLTGPNLVLARIAEKTGDSEAMYRSLEKARKQSPKSLRARAMLAELYLRDKNIKEAEIVIKEGLKAAPEALAFRLLMARVKIEQKKFNEALTWLKEIVEKSPSSIYARSLLSETFVNLKDYGSAMNHLNIILKDDPEYVPAISLQAAIDLQKGNFDQAIKLAERSVKLNPALKSGYEIIGEASLRKGLYEQAREYFQLAYDRGMSAKLAIKSSNAAMHLNQYEEAAEPLIHWLGKKPDDAVVRQYLGSVYLANGDNNKAVEEFELVLEAMPENIAALNNLAWLYAIIGNKDALSMAEKAFKLEPENGRILDTYGWILVQQGELAKGRKIIERAIEKMHDNADIQYHYAFVLAKTGESHQAMSVLSRILKSDTYFDERDEAEKLYESLKYEYF